MKKLLFLITLFTSCLCLLPASQLRAQEDPVLKSIYNDINELYSKKAEQALKRDMNRFERMKTELEEVDKIKDNPGKKKGLDNYNRAHKEHFRKMLKDGGVNLQQVLMGLQQKYPDYSFSIVDDFSIIVRKKESTGSGSAASVMPEVQADQLYFMQRLSGPNNENSNATVTGDVLMQELVFIPSKTVSCKMASGGNVEFGSRMIKAWSTGVSAADCITKGQLMNQTLIPVRVRSASLTLNGTVESTGFAIGIFGTAICAVTTNINVKIVETNTYFNDVKLFQNSLAIAPVLWFASFNEVISNNYVLDLTPWRGRTVQITASAYSNSIAVICCGTSSTSKATINTAFLSLVQ